MLLIFIGKGVYAFQSTDPDDITINISCNPVFLSLQPYWIDIYRTKGNIKIVYSIRKSLQLDLLNNNNGYISIRQDYDVMFHSDPASKKWTDLQKDSLSTKFESLLRNYAICDKDSLLLDRKMVASYDSLLNHVNNAGVSELENTEANKNRHLLDGVFFGFTIISPTGSKKAQAQSPEALSHPLLYELLTKTCALYRDIKNNNFLDKRKTFGY